MATAITFLKNYMGFGRNIRPITGNLLYNSLIEVKDIKTRNTYFLRLFEENMSSSEDLLYWASAAYMRDAFPDGVSNEWDFLLNVGIKKEISNEVLISNLRKMSRIPTGQQLLKSFGVVSLSQFSEFGKLGVPQIIQIANKLLSTIKACHHNRTIATKALLRGHNKIKHGMLVVDEGNSIYIRDYVASKGVNRNFDLKVDLKKAKSLLGTIQANAMCLQLIISVLLYRHSLDFIEANKRGLTDIERSFWEESVNYKYT